MTSSLDLSVEMKAADGSTVRWGSDEPNAANIPRGITFGTRLMHGFADCGLTLARRIDGEYFDLGLLDEITLIGGDGSIAYEGRVGGIPRSFDNEHSVSLQCGGWMSHAMDRKFTEVYVDRDIAQWRAPSRARQVALAAAWVSSQADVSSDETNAVAALRMPIRGPWPASFKPLCEAWYDAGPGNKVGKVYYDYQNNANTSSGDAAWVLELYRSDLDDGTSATSVTGDLLWGGANGTYATLTTPQRYAFWDFLYNTANAGQEIDYGIFLRRLTVYGDHSVTTRPAVTSGDPEGVWASDVINDVVGRFCPMLKTTNVEQTYYPIPHLVFRDQTSPYDAFLELNKFHLWDLSCWEGKTLRYAPSDLTDYDWEIRTDAEGTTISLQGDSIENLASGIVVQYPNLATGQTDILRPEDHDELRDDGIDNPFNAHGYSGQTDITVSYPTTQDAALQIGRAALAEFNRPRSPGSITKTHFIRDRHGTHQPVWKVRSGDRVSVTSSVNLSDRPRLITETSYNHDSKSLTMTVEGPSTRMEAVSDRILTALTAAGLS